MASGRDKNQIPNYLIHQRGLEETRNWGLNEQRVFAHYVALPQATINVGQMPNFLLSANSTDIESFLRGVGANNFINPQGTFRPELRKLPEATFFEREKYTIIPKPLTIEDNQRYTIFRK